MFFPKPNPIVVQVLQGHSPFKQLVKRYDYTSSDHVSYLNCILHKYTPKPVRLTALVLVS